MGKDLRERFSGAIEALTRRNVSSQGAHGDRSTRYNRSSDVKKDKVGFCYYFFPWPIIWRKFDLFVGFTVAARVF